MSDEFSLTTDASDGAVSRSVDSNSNGGIVKLLAVLLRHRRLVIVAAGITAAVVVVVTLVIPATYTSRVSFIPQDPQTQLSDVAGIASQFGIDVPVGSPGKSPAFHANLLESRGLLREAVLTEYGSPNSGDQEQSTGSESRMATLVEIYEVPGDTQDRRIANAIGKLRSKIAVSVNNQTNVVEFAIEARDPRLAKELSGRLMDLVNRFNVETRQTQASAEREFLEDRVLQAHRELRAVEDSLERFLENNRHYQDSPQLRFSYQRLQRRVDFQQSVHSSLVQAYEQAKIRQVRNTPVVTVIDGAELPAEPDRRYLLMKGLLGLLVGGMLGGIWAVGREVVASSRRVGEADYKALKVAWSDTVRDLRRLWRRVTGLVRR